MVALLGVRDHVLVREFDTLRGAFGTRTEQDDGVVVQVGCGKPQTAKYCGRAEVDDECRNKAAYRRHLCFFFVQVNHLALACDLCEGGVLSAKFVEEGVRRDNGSEVGLFDATENRIDRCRVVQVHCRLAGAENRHNAEGGVAAGGKHKAHVTIVFRDRLDDLAEIVAKANHVVAVDVVAGRVN